MPKTAKMRENLQMGRERGLEEEKKRERSKRREEGGAGGGPKQNPSHRCGSEEKGKGEREREETSFFYHSCT